MLLVLLVGIPAAIYFLTKYDDKLYPELTKFRTFIGSSVLAVLAFGLGKCLTPAFYIFVPILALVSIVSMAASEYKSNMDLHRK